MDHYKRIKILLAVICSILLVVACSCGISESIGQITILDLCGYNESDTPTELHYSYDNSGGIKEVTVEDEAIIKQTLAAILDTKVHNRGLQVDMYVYESVTYEYVYDDHTIRFSFIPYSYFAYDGEYYEISESGIKSLSVLFDDAETESSDTQSFGDIPEIETSFIDNGDEARSVTLITIHTDKGDVEGYIEGAYNIVSITKEADYYDIEYLYGDFYSHEEKKHSRITIEDGNMVITELN